MHLGEAKRQFKKILKRMKEMKEKDDEGKKKDAGLKPWRYIKTFGIAGKEARGGRPEGRLFLCTKKHGTGGLFPQKGTGVISVCS